MSAIDTTFHFVRNPTAINGLATIDGTWWIEATNYVD